MLGRVVRVNVTAPIHSKDSARGFVYELNYGELVGFSSRKGGKINAFILGVNHPVRTFDGRIIASFERSGRVYYVVAPRNRKYIINDVQKALAFEKPRNIRCYYECSCGAVVFRRIYGEYRFLIIKNNRSTNWSFPKGHVEDGETYEMTAKREVLEETGLHIKLVPGFRETSHYMIQNRVSKSVILFAATTKDANTIIQQSELEDYVWLPYESCMDRLKFENDRSILTDCRNYLIENGYLASD